MPSRTGLPRVDVHFTGERIALSEIVRLAQLAERSGLGGVWHAEGFRDSLVPLTTIACATERIRIGTGVALIPLRDPFSTAKATARSSAPSTRTRKCPGGSSSTASTGRTSWP